MENFKNEYLKYSVPNQDYLKKMEFKFTEDNLIENIHKLGAWSSYGLATVALQHYFPNEYDADGYCNTTREVELLEKLGCMYWHDVIIKYHMEIGYITNDGSFDELFVNER